MSHLAMMLDSCFMVFGVDALYTPIDGSSAHTVRAIVKKLDSVVHVGAAQIISSSSAIDIRISDVAKPQIGDQIAMGGTNFVVGSDPLRDPERLIWTLSTSPPSLWDPSAGLPPGPADGGGF